MGSKFTNGFPCISNVLPYTVSQREERRGRKTLETGELFLETLHVRDEAGVERSFDYYILLEHLELEGYSGESYGVKIEEKETGEVAIAPDVTCRSSVIYQLAQTLLLHQVTPCTLVDVIQDWLS